MTGTKSSRTKWRLEGRGLLRVALGLFLVLPYLVWILSISEWHWPPFSQWAGAVEYALMQSVLSAIFTCLGGFILFRALQASPRRGRAELALLLPNLVPPLFVALALLALVTRVTAFPYGVGAVIATHVLLNSGLVAIALDRAVQSRLGGMSEAAWVMGASPSVFTRKVALPLLRGDLACLFLFVFSLCFTSFSIPLLLSGARAVTLEVAIFDAIRTDGAWDRAVLLAALQSGVLLALAYLLPQPFWPSRASRASLKLFAWPWARPLIVAPAFALVLGWLAGGLSGAAGGLPPEVWHLLPAAMLTTLAIGLATGLVHLLLFLLTAFVLPHSGLDRFLNGYLAPSAAVTAFGLLLIPLEGWDLAKLILALTLISYPLLYRWVVHAALAELRAQVTVARTMGATHAAILLDVVWPQAAPALLRASGLAAVWACGDFALSGILLNSGSVSLPLMIEDLLGNYRYEPASLLLLWLAAASLMLYAFFMRAARYVTG